MLAKKPSRFIPELEGLRGLLALWVFIFHAVRFSGMHISLLSEGGLAVQVFIILSGFMIGRLRIFKSESYLSYLLRRFARLYPAYMIAIILGISVSSLISHTYAAVPWEVDDIARMIGRHGIEQAHFLPILLGHLTMLHGILPEEILPGSSLGFVGPAWSLSLEWQFYLVAPVIVWFLTSRRFQAASIIGILIISVATPHMLKNYTYIVPSFLPQMLAYFLVGIISALLFDHFRELRPELLVIGGGAIIAALVGAASTWEHTTIPFVIWIVAIMASLGPQIPELKMASWLLTCRPVEFLGRISYGFYLFHSSVYICTAAGLLAMGVHTRLMMLTGIIAIALPITLLLATASYFGMELPVMHYVKQRLQKNIISP